MKIIILDDEQMIVDLIETVCKRAGVEDIVYFTDSKSALENLAQFENADLVFLDRVMPGLHGDDFLPVMCNMGLRVVIVTGMASQYDHVDSPCIIKTLSKPFSLKEIKEIVESVQEEIAQYQVDKEMTTCWHCAKNNDCAYAWDAYNTDGDCLAGK